MTENSEKDRLFVLRLKDIVLSNLGDNNFGVNELVSRSGMTHYVLIHRLQAVTGKTINQFIRESRLQKALEMIQEEDLTASEVAYKTGFGSATYFNTCFTEYFGFPPGAVIKGEVKIKNKLTDGIPDPVKIKTKAIWNTMIFTVIGVAILSIMIYLGKVLIFENIIIGSGLNSHNPEKSIAILPFKNLGNNEEDNYFIDGITDELQLRLSGLPDLRIVSRPLNELLNGGNEPASVIARKLKVNYILNGSCQKFGNSFRLRVQLIDASDDRQIWAEAFNEEIRETKDITKVQSFIAQAVAEKLKAEISPEVLERIEKTPTLNLNAYDFYQRGREEADKLGTYDFNPEIIGCAEDFFRKALSHDKTFAQAYLGLAGLLWKRWYLDYNVLNGENPDKYLDSMLILANTALKYDSKNEEAYMLRGSYFSVKGTPEQAIKEYNKALKYNPNFAPAYFRKGGLLEEIDILNSIINFHKASTLSHGSELANTLVRIGCTYYNAGFSDKGDYFLREARKLEYDSVPYCLRTAKIIADTRGDYNMAAEYCEKRVLKDSTNIILLRDLGYYYLLSGNLKKSLNYYKKYISLYDNNTRPTPFLNRFTYLGYVFQQNGYKKEADYFYEKQINIYTERLKSILPTEKIYWAYPLAGIYAANGNKSKALEYLKMFGQNPSYTLNWVTLMKNDPLLNSIRNEPEFLKILKEIESKYLSEHEKVGKWIEENEP